MSAKEVLVGAHVSIAKSLHLAFERGESIGCTAIQIFTKSCRTMFGKPLQPNEISRFKEATKKSSIASVIVHAGYLINICSQNAKTEKQSTSALAHELDRCVQLGIPYLVLHPGAHLGAGETKGLEKIATNLAVALERAPGSVSVLLETMAGQGTTLGNTFEQLKIIRNACYHKKRIGVCLDTCHIFCAGYDISTQDGYKKVMHNFDQIIGLEHLKAIHFNNSKDKLSAHVDRHTPLEQGNIPLAIFKLIINDQRLSHIPKILETPAEPDMKLWKKEIALLKSFV